MEWRRERDSNPRAQLPTPTGLANPPLQPLGYPSTGQPFAIIQQYSPWRKTSRNDYGASLSVPDSFTEKASYCAYTGFIEYSPVPVTPIVAVAFRTR